MRTERSSTPRRFALPIMFTVLIAAMAAATCRQPAGAGTDPLIELIAFGALPRLVQERLVAAGAAPAARLSHSAAGPAALGPPPTDEQYAPVRHLVSRACFDRIHPSHRALLRCVAESRAAGETFNVAMCFEPGIDPEFAERFSAELYGDGGGVDRFQQTTRWSTTATDGSGLGQGDPTTLTYSFVPDGTNVPCIAGACWPDAPSNFQQWMTALYGSPAVWEALFVQVFDRWSELCGITYVYEPNDDGVEMNGAPGVLGVRGDVRIGGKSLDGASGVLAYNNFPQDGDMVFDTFDGYYLNMSNDSRRFRNVLAHEHGHGMGQLHVCPADATKLMEPYIVTVYDGPQPDDVLGAQRHYGDTWEHNDQPQTATDLGTLDSGLSTIVALSIDDNTDEDYFRVTLDSAQEVTATMRPTGAVYPEGPQTQDCDTGSLFNSLALKDLQVELRASDGTTVLANGNTQPAGMPETASYVFPGPGVFYVFVRGGTENTIQSYELDILLEAPPFVPVSIALLDPVPAQLMPGVAASFDVAITAGDDAIVPGSTNLHYRFEPGSFSAVPLTHLSGSTWRATVPPASCDDAPEFYVSATGAASGEVTNPVAGANAPFSALVGSTSIAFADDFEQNLGWTVSGNVSDGGWDRGDPVIECDRGSPLFDADGSGQCYLTDNSAANACNSDVDSGTTTVTSPVFDLAGGGSISWWYWLNDIPSGPIGVEDEMTVEVATNPAGSNWATVRVYTTAANEWRSDSIVLSPSGDALPSATVRVRFSVSDNSPGDVIEAGLDALEAIGITCDDAPPCLTDVTGPAGASDGNVDALDLLQLIGQWGTPCGKPCNADVTGPIPGVPDGNVDSLELLKLISEWGSPGNCG